MTRCYLLFLLSCFIAFQHASAHSLKKGEAPVFDEALRAHILAEWKQKQAHHSGEIKSPQVASTASVFHLAAAAVANAKGAPVQSQPFQAFPKLEIKWDPDFLYVGSNGLPDHSMMVGITAWQQQVPLPHSYFGDNAWRIPLHPIPAKEPALIKGRFLRGAIALAANGIPIFNPQNNRGEVSQEIGELDQWGGHCGRADDYHYHSAPLHLQSVVGKGMPIAYALDGYPIFGLTEPDGSPVADQLDVCLGHETPGTGYHYHASLKYPYVLGGFHGEVVEAGGQVDPQPRAQGVRPDTPPLRGAVITGFKSTGPNSYQLTYTLDGSTRSISYSINADGSYPFEYNNGSNDITREVYTARQGGGGKGDAKGKGDTKGKGKGKGMRDNPPPAPPSRDTIVSPPSASSSTARDANGDGIVTAHEFAEAAKREFAASNDGRSLASAMQKARTAFTSLDKNNDGRLDASEQGEPSENPNTAAFILTSPVVEDGGALPRDYTGDGSGATLPLTWSGAPARTQSYAIIMDHEAPGNEMKGYWNLWDIPTGVTSLPKNVQGIGKTGAGFRGEAGYEPPHSKGPGAKTYVLHVYALSAPPEISLPRSQVNREVLLAAIQGKILGHAKLSVVYSRADSAGDAPPTDSPPRPRPEGKGGKPKGRSDSSGLIKPGISDTIKLNVYADNWFMLYVNGRLVAVDPIQFTPHNVVSVDFLPEYPMTLAVLAKDNADPKTGMEYGTNIGDGGFILKFADGTVTNATWKARSFFHGPLNSNTASPEVKHDPLPANWWAVDFDDASWPNAKEYSEEQVDPKQPYFENDFAGASFIWSDSLALDNTVIFRTRIDKPEWKQRWNTQPDLDVSGAPQR